MKEQRIMIYLNLFNEQIKHTIKVWLNSHLKMFIPGSADAELGMNKKVLATLANDFSLQDANHTSVLPDLKVGSRGG